MISFKPFYGNYEEKCLNIITNFVSCILYFKQRLTTKDLKNNL